MEIPNERKYGGENFFFCANAEHMESFLCHLCDDVLREAQTICPAHCLCCLDCINQRIHRGEPFFCRCDVNPKAILEPCPSVQSVIDNHKVVCKWCNFKTKKNEFSSHEDVCESMEQSCQWCNVITTRKGKNNHESMCEKKEYLCPTFTTFGKCVDSCSERGGKVVGKSSFDGHINDAAYLNKLNSIRSEALSEEVSHPWETLSTNDHLNNIRFNYSVKRMHHCEGTLKH